MDIDLNEYVGKQMRKVKCEGPKSYHPLENRQLEVGDVVTVYKIIDGEHFQYRINPKLNPGEVRQGALIQLVRFSDFELLVDGPNQTSKTCLCPNHVILWGHLPGCDFATPAR